MSDRAPPSRSASESDASAKRVSAGWRRCARYCPGRSRTHACSPGQPQQPVLWARDNSAAVATCRSSQPVVAGVQASPGPIVSRRTHQRGPTRRWRSPARLLGRLAGQPQVVLRGPLTPPSAPSLKVRSILGSAMLTRKDTPPHRGRAPPLPSTKRRRCRTTDLRPRRSTADAVLDAVVHEQSRSSGCRDPAQLRQRPCGPGTLLAPWRVRTVGTTLQQRP